MLRWALWLCFAALSASLLRETQAHYRGDELDGESDESTDGFVDETDEGEYTDSSEEYYYSDEDSWSAATEERDSGGKPHSTAVLYDLESSDKATRLPEVVQVVTEPRRQASPMAAPLEEQTGERSSAMHSMGEEAASQLNAAHNNARALDGRRRPSREGDWAREQLGGVRRGSRTEVPEEVGREGGNGFTIRNASTAERAKAEMDDLSDRFSDLMGSSSSDEELHHHLDDIDIDDEAFEDGQRGWELARSEIKEFLGNGLEFVAAVEDAVRPYVVQLDEMLSAEFERLYFSAVRLLDGLRPSGADRNPFLFPLMCFTAAFLGAWLAVKWWRRNSLLLKVAKIVEKTSEDADWTATGWKRVYSSFNHLKKGNDATTARMEKLEDAFRHFVKTSRLSSSPNFVAQEDSDGGKLAELSPASTRPTTSGSDREEADMGIVLERLGWLDAACQKSFGQIITCWDVLLAAVFENSGLELLQRAARSQDLPVCNVDIRKFVVEARAQWDAQTTFASEAGDRAKEYEDVQEEEKNKNTTCSPLVS